MNLERPGSQQALVERTSSRRTTLLGRNASRGQLERPGSQQAIVDAERRQRRMLHTDSEQALIDGERNPADLGTKVLEAVRYQYLLRLWNVKTLLEYQDLRKQHELVTQLYHSAPAMVLQQRQRPPLDEESDEFDAFDEAT